MWQVDSTVNLTDTILCVNSIFVRSIFFIFVNLSDGKRQCRQIFNISSSKSQNLNVFRHPQAINMHGVYNQASHDLMQMFVHYQILSVRFLWSDEIIQNDIEYFTRHVCPILQRQKHLNLPRLQPLSHEVRGVSPLEWALNRVPMGIELGPKCSTFCHLSQLGWHSDWAISSGAPFTNMSWL